MDYLDFSKLSEEEKNRERLKTLEKTGFEDFGDSEVKEARTTSYIGAGIRENAFRKIDERTGKLIDAQRPDGMSIEEYKLGRARSLAQENVRMSRYALNQEREGIVLAGHMSGEMKAICDAMEDITKCLNKTVDCTGVKNNGKHGLNWGVYRGYIGEVLGAYDKTLEKITYYLHNKHPRKTEGKNRYKMVASFYSYLMREKEAFGANAQIKEREMNEKQAKSVTGTDILFDIRAEIIEKTQRVTNAGATGTSRTYEKDGKTYYYKEEKEVEMAGRSFSDSVQAYLLHSDYIQEHVKTKEDKLKDNIADLIVGLELELGGDAPIIDELFDGLAKGNVNAENFTTFMETCLLRAGYDAVTIEILVKAVSKRFEETKAGSEEFLDALNQVINYNKANSFAAYNGIKAGRMLGFRNVASSRMAELLGNKDCIAESKTVLITDENGAIHRGNSMAKAEGYTVEQLAGKCSGLIFSGKAKRTIAELQFIDFICGQQDRHMENYIVKAEIKPQKCKDGKIRNFAYIDSIVGIDNDMSFGIFSYNDLKAGRNRLGGPESGGKKFAMKKISRSLYNRIMNTDLSVFKYALADLGLSANEMDALINRIEGIRSYITRARRHFGKSFIMENDEEWNDLSSEDIFDGSETVNFGEEHDEYQSLFGGLNAAIAQENLATNL